MKILGLNLEHDGGAALVDAGRLLEVVDGQKDNQGRHAKLGGQHWPRFEAWLAADFETVAVGGWTDHGLYYGIDTSAHSWEPMGSNHARAQAFWFMTSHERAHILCSYALSPFPQGTPCYALVWEGAIGRFYSIDGNLGISLVCEPLPSPGQRYALLYELAHPDFGDREQGLSISVAGKLMALANSYGAADKLQPDDSELLQRLCSVSAIDGGEVPRKGSLRESRFWNIGHTHPAFREFAKRASDRLFDTFFAAIRPHVTLRRPLIIGGGCGLNCNWNTAWRDSGLFDDVFIPPCTDDSGISIGAAADAQWARTGSAKLDWTIYCGEQFVHDVPVPAAYKESPLDAAAVARALCDGAIVAWSEGRYELGPRALGHRSILAAPFERSMQDKLNQLKHREPYRPVAPICREEDVSRHFAWSGPSPHMLFFQHVLDETLQAVTHDDGTARLQSVTRGQSPRMYELLTSFAELTGTGVLCNTSLNFPGRGFINRTSDLLEFVSRGGVDLFVIDGRMYTVR